MIGRIMRLTEILKPECIVVPLESTDKHDAICILADRLADVAGIEDHDDLKQAIWQREQTRTTGIGHGVAIPHGKCKGCTELQMAVGRTANPLDFAAIDGNPVDLIFLLASPIDQTGPHIEALACISHMLTDADMREAIIGAPDAQTMYKLIREHEAAQMASS